LGEGFILILTTASDWRKAVANKGLLNIGVARLDQEGNVIWIRTIVGVADAGSTQKLLSIQ
jgi:hypothetical protein